MVSILLLFFCHLENSLLLVTSKPQSMGGKILLYSSIRSNNNVYAKHKTIAVITNQITVSETAKDPKITPPKFKDV